MDKSAAFAMIHQYVHQSDDASLIEAWNVLTAIEAPSPPTAVGLAQIEAGKLAHQLYKTGLDFEWEPPPHHSRAMERLIFRITNLLEAFLNLYGYTEATDND